MITLKTNKILIRKIKSDYGNYLGQDGNRYSLQTATEVNTPNDIADSWVEADSLTDYLLDNQLKEIPLEEKAVTKPLTLEQSKKLKLSNAHTLFEQKRDSIAWVDLPSGHYGFDTKAEDIVNFIAGKMAVEEMGQTYYKVWLSETTKGMVLLNINDFKLAFEVARQQQMQAYAWFEKIKAKILACETFKEIEEVQF